MAKIKGPLHSLDARGNLARGAMQFRGGLRGVHAYKPVPPGQYTAGPTQAQLDHRALYGAAIEAWRALTPEERDAWNQTAAASARPVSGWNLFLAENIGTMEMNGGTTHEFEDEGGIIWKVHVFNASDDLEVVKGGSVEYLIVSGGGAGGSGGNGGNGGGGAGGLVTGSMSLSPGTSPIIVGLGGIAELSYGNGGSGGISSAFGIEVAGGPGGAQSGAAGLDGVCGSGGGGGGATGVVAPGGNGSMGGNGGDGGGVSINKPAGGGGGMGSDGLNGSVSGGGNGGIGVESTITGTSEYYCGGGGGGAHQGSVPSAGGLGGGGNGGLNAPGGNAESNTGGGGGGSGHASTDFPGGSGGSGVVVVRYQI